MKPFTICPCSLQLLVYVQVVVLISSIHWHLMQVNALGNETDRLALLHFKESIVSDPRGILNSWNGSVHHCNWIGVTCNARHQRVESLILEGHRLSGSISPHIGNLSFLRNLNIQNNSFHGPIPQEVGKLFRLHNVILGNNTLGGEIPVNLTSCSKLEIVILRRNNLSGNIPPQLGSLMKLQQLRLAANSLTGNIPSSLGNLSTLQGFSAVSNKLVGEIPGEMSRLKHLTFFAVSDNHLSGIIPPSLFNISSIQSLLMSINKFHGGLPEKVFNLPNLVEADFGANQLSGKIPNSIMNASRLQLLDIPANNFVGPVPANMGDLSSLRMLNIGRNNLGTNSMDDLKFLASLASCRDIEIIDIIENHFKGNLNVPLANISTQLSELYVGRNLISGTIPSALENLTNFVVLGLENNLFTGVIPSYIGKLQKLQQLFLNTNQLSGTIPEPIGNLTNLSFLDLTKNNLHGSIPSSIGKCQNLYWFGADQNKLTGNIPEEILNLSSVSTYFGLSNNLLIGNLPQAIGKLAATNVMDISSNLLSDKIPVTIGDCLSLEELYMQGNFFQGEIPKSVASLKGLQILDLSQDNLTGNIPKSLQNLTYLQFLNISFNNFKREVPTGGVFGNASTIFLDGNKRLCGGISKVHLPKCPSGKQKKGKTITLKLPIIFGCLVLCVGFITVLLVLFWKKKSKPKPSSSTFEVEPHIMVPYKSLHKATGGFSPQNLLGYGNFGFVYKGLLDQVEKPVAIKILNLQQQGVSKSIMAECNALKNIRHRNLVKLITFCSSLDYQGNEFKALVFEFMSNESLENWLHSDANQPRRLDMLQRLNIAIDVASALHYLHDLCEVSIIHRDLKPSNVLLDDDMVGHIGDFGLAKFLSAAQSSSQNQTSTVGIQGTTGYVAPEFGVGAAASKEGDIYSFGILLLEMFSGRRPTDEMFTDGLNLVDFIKKALPRRVMQVADPILSASHVDETEAASSSTPPMREEEGSDQETELVRYRTAKMRPHELRCLQCVLEIGVSCSEESPDQRANLGDVLRKLHRVKDTFLSVQMNLRIRA